MKPILLLLFVSLCYPMNQSPIGLKLNQMREQRDTVFVAPKVLVTSNDTVYVYRLVEIRIKVREGETIQTKGGGDE